jgi:4-hydroxy-3-methylbut-2-en-1-yl diphosphate reductase
MHVQLANPRGFCAGVDRAIAIVERALELFGAPIYVRHEVVHNRYVVDCLRENGAVFVEELHEVPDGATLIFSAHGVSQAVRREAEQRGLKVYDATCPLVTKVHMEVARHARDGHEVILIGHAGHPEVEGTMGQYDSTHGGNIYLVENCDDVAALLVNHPDELAYVTQTTLSMDDAREIINALKQRFPKIAGPKKDDICYATQNRQDAVRQLAESSDVVLVVGSLNSSNSNRLRELASRLERPAYLIDNADDLQKEWFNNVEKIGISAGASAPEVLVKAVIERLQEWGVELVEEGNGQREEVIFPLPKALAKP